MENINLNFIYDVTNILNSSYDFNKVIENLRIVFNKYLNTTNFKIYTMEASQNSIYKDIEKNWIMLDELTQKMFDSFNKKINEVDNKEKYIIINDDVCEFSKIQNLSESNKVYIPFKKYGKIFAFLELENINIKILKTNLLKTFEVILSQISFATLNNLLNNQMQINIKFYDAMKNIAKIIENQYELNYIIPIIGEMIDRFIVNHLIYVFIKDEQEQYKLIWPLSCKDENIIKMLNKVTFDQEYIISDDKKIAIFPLKSENKILGAIAASSNIYPLNDREMTYLLQLANQSSTTIARANMYSEILKHATMDALTGLNNRRQFEIRLNQEFATAKRKNKKLCCMMTDIDYFKKINDTYGHIAGDIVLKKVASIIESQLREYDTASRYGGEEFCILLPYTTIEEAKFVAERLRKKVESEKIDISQAYSEQKEVQVTISIGVSEFNEHTILTPKDLYKKADEALYQAKEQGRNRVILYQND
ncbi:MAG: hypothetical protein BHW64_05220 [Candidatus Melainabacteria bacterium LEY3_CP_29_8]|nr:MAG: hypothetical protein BHW64_05220 [Candidatus Melainabacteria bacterium LEY3_CP_29_8]